MNFIRWLKGKLNLKAGDIFSSFYLGISGVVMIFMGIQDVGFIDLKTPFITGQAKSGFVGMLLIFSSVVIVICSLFTRKSKHKLSIRKGGFVINWEGSVSTVEEFDLIRYLIEENFSSSDRRKS